MHLRMYTTAIVSNSIGFGSTSPDVLIRVWDIIILIQTLLLQGFHMYILLVEVDLSCLFGNNLAGFEQAGSLTWQTRHATSKH